MTFSTRNLLLLCGGAPVLVAMLLSRVSPFTATATFLVLLALGIDRHKDQFFLLAAQIFSLGMVTEMIEIIRVSDTSSGGIATPILASETTARYELPNSTILLSGLLVWWIYRRRSGEFFRITTVSSVVMTFDVLLLAVTQSSIRFMLTVE